MPVAHQLLLMKGRPFHHHGRRAIRDVPLESNDGINSDLRLIPGIDGVEVRRIMVVEIHTNDNAEETADLWHSLLFYHAGNASEGNRAVKSVKADRVVAEEPVDL